MLYQIYTDTNMSVIFTKYSQVTTKSECNYRAILSYIIPFDSPGCPIKIKAQNRYYNLKKTLMFHLGIFILLNESDQQVHFVARSSSTDDVC